MQAGCKAQPKGMSVSDHQNTKSALPKLEPKESKEDNLEFVRFLFSYPNVLVTFSLIGIVIGIVTSPLIITMIGN